VNEFYSEELITTQRRQLHSRWSCSNLLSPFSRFN